MFILGPDLCRLTIFDIYHLSVLRARGLFSLAVKVNNAVLSAKNACAPGAWRAALAGENKAGRHARQPV
jgi:hypothetical protein